MAQFTKLFVKRVKFYSASAGNQNGKAKILGSAALCETFWEIYLRTKISWLQLTNHFSEHILGLNWCKICSKTTNEYVYCKNLYTWLFSVQFFPNFQLSFMSWIGSYVTYGIEKQGAEMKNELKNSIKIY